MHPYAKTVIDALKPSRSFLYLVQDFFNQLNYFKDCTPRLLSSPNIRNGRTHKFPPSSFTFSLHIRRHPFFGRFASYDAIINDLIFVQEKDAQLFAPPNLLQSTSASFLVILSVTKSNGTVILLPSPHIPQPPPKQIAPSNISQLTYDDVEWDSQLINEAQILVFRAIGEEVKHSWAPLANQPKEKLPKRNTEVGEGGMYI